MQQNYLKELNKKQQEVVTYTKGPLMIIAGAGSGKTKVLTSRIAHLIHSGVDSFRIMALTFTNKAAQEMKERVERLLQSAESRNVYSGTFHAIFARILRKEAEALGYLSNFTIYDTDDTKSVLKQIINTLNLDSKTYKLPAVYHQISSAKNELVSPEMYEADSMRRAADESKRIPQLYAIYRYYEKQCFKNNAMDFDDILLNTYKLFDKFPLVLHQYQHKITHILIDEFQDTNPLQYAIIKKLGQVHQNICVVGDDAQSIYSFRGATIQNILQFTKDFPDAHTVKLEQNYRSSGHILQTANDIIKHNKHQIPKELWTENTQGEKIHLHTFRSENDEARFIAEKITELSHRYHLRHDNFAILYRNNAQSRVLEEHLRRSNIPYIIYGGYSFYQRKEVKDLIAYLRIVINPKDDEALKRIINYPIRGIGQVSVQKYLTFAYENEMPLYEVLENIAHFETRKTHIQTIQGFTKMIGYFQAESRKKDVYELATIVAKQTGIQKELHSEKTPEGIAKYENIEELLNSIKEFVDNNENQEETTLEHYLQQITLLTSGDDEKKDGQSSVKLMTIHAAKGLEFACVYVAGMQDGLFPSMYSMYSREALEEERRLFYVAITRAKSRLYISHSTTQYRHGSIEYANASQFLTELNPEHIHERSIVKTVSPTNPINYKNLVKNVAVKAPLHKISDDFSPTEDALRFQVNTKVEHEKFGYGTIKALSGEKPNAIATISFEHFGEKKIMIKYSKMEAQQ